LTEEGDIPRLFNYGGRKYNIADTIGILEKDPQGSIILRKDKRGRFVDKAGRPVNRKGYLVDGDGNVIDSQGRVVFEQRYLEDDEIPKIFPFTTLKTRSLQGDYDVDPLGNPVLDKNEHGHLVDRKGKRVNSKGHLVDPNGNVINQDGRNQVQFKKGVLDPDGDIPKVFRTGLLKSDSDSSLSQLMSDIEKNQMSDIDNDLNDLMNKRPKFKKSQRSGATSEGSQMGVSPADFNE
jgi:hypothetical protein